MKERQAHDEWEDLSCIFKYQLYKNYFFFNLKSWKILRKRVKERVKKKKRSKWKEKREKREWNYSGIN